MNFWDVIQEIVEAAGQTERLLQRGEHFRLRIENSPQACQVFHGRENPRYPLVVLGARHPAARDPVGGRSDLVGRQIHKKLAPAPKQTDVGAEELVG